MKLVANRQTLLFKHLNSLALIFGPFQTLNDSLIQMYLAKCNVFFCKWIFFVLNKTRMSEVIFNWLKHSFGTFWRFLTKQTVQQRFPKWNVTMFKEQSLIVCYQLYIVEFKMPTYPLLFVNYLFTIFFVLVDLFWIKFNSLPFYTFCTLLCNIDVY